MTSTDAVPTAHARDKYALSFVQNFVVLRSLWIGGVGPLVLIALVFTPRPEACGTVAPHLIVTLGVASVLGVRDARRRFALLYWRGRIAPVMRRQYGYEYEELSQMTVWA